MGFFDPVAELVRDKAQFTETVKKTTKVGTNHVPLNDVKAERGNQTDQILLALPERSELSTSPLPVTWL